MKTKLAYFIPEFLLAFAIIIVLSVANVYADDSGTFRGEDYSGKGR
jgi:hypothetical protein